MAALLIVVALTVYWPALDAGFIWDDDDHVTANPTLRSLGGLRDIWFKLGATPQYYPVVHTTFWIEYHAWREWAGGYHLVNVILHALNAGLVWLILRRLAIPGGWIAAVLFLVHPVHVESVAWITERKNTLSGLFYLAAAWNYLRFLEDAQAGERWFRNRSFVWAFLLYAAALLSKTVTCSLPAALLLIVWWRKGRITRRDLAPTLPFFALGFALSAVTVYMERHQVGAVGDDWSLTLMQRVYIAGRAVWFYGFKLLWPRRLAFVYPRWDVDAVSWWQELFPAAAAVVCIALLLGLRSRLGRGPLVAVLFFAGTLVPALGFINIYPMRYTFVADHYQYLASVGILALGGVGVAWLLERWSSIARLVAGAVPALLVLVLSALSRGQTAIYHDQVALWSDTIAKNPRCWMAYNNLGIALAEDRSTLTAEKQSQLDQLFETALHLNPTSPETQNSLSSWRLIEGRADEAADHARESLRLAPDFAAAHANYGAALARQGKLNDARKELQTAIRLKPALAEAHSNLANVLTMQDHIHEALIEFQTALEINPDSFQGRLNYALALADHGRTDEALRQYQLLLARRPESAEVHFQFGNLLLKFKRDDLAQQQFLLATQLDPRHSRAYNNLGALRLKLGDVAAAIRFLSQALEADPSSQSARDNLAAARRMQRP